MTLLVSPLILITATIIGCKSEQLRCSWTGEPIVADGKLQDWEGKPTRYFEDRGAVIGLSNDNDFLYVHFRTKDAKWAGLIKRTGLTLYIDTGGGKDKNFYIRFFDGPDVPAMKRHFRGDSASVSDDMPAPPGFPASDFAGKKDGRRLLCFVKDRIVEMPIAIDGSQGPGAAYDTCWGFYCYEFAIPLRESAVRYYGLNSEAGKTISIGAVWGDMGDMRPRAQADMGDRPPGGGMPPGGGRGGKFPGGPSGGMRMAQKQEVWFKTTLAMPSGERQNTEEEF